jgi:hypothetical protein
MFVNLVVEMEARNIAQRNAIYFVLNSVRMPQHMENLSRPLQCQRAQAFRWHNMFSESRTVVEDE